MRRGVTVALLALGSLGASGAGGPGDPDPAAWTQRKTVRLPPLTAPAFVEALLDDEVYRDAAPGFADLRIRDREGRDVGYVLRRHERPQERAERDLPVLDRAELPGREVRFVLDVHQAGAAFRLHDRIRIRISDRLRNFRVPVKVETSADGRTWQLVRAAGFVYAVEGESRAADTTVSYPPSSARFLRVTIAPADGRPIPVDGAAIVLETPATRDEDVRAAPVVERRGQAPARTSRLVVDLGGRRPVDRLELDVAVRTFSRLVFVEADAPGDGWRPVGSGHVSAIQTPRLTERETSIRFSEVSARRLRITIDNGEDRPLDVAGVRVATVRRGLVFEARPGGAYTLDYGNPRVGAPRYDVARAVPYLASERLPEAVLDPARRLEIPAVDRRWDGGMAVWVAMGVAGVALAGLLVRLARQLKPSAG